MSLGGYLSDLLTGSPWGTADAGEAAGEAADTQNQAINQQLLDSGQLSQAQYNQTVADFNQSTADEQGGIGGQLLDAGVQGASEAVSNAASAVTNVATSPFKALWAAITAPYKAAKAAGTLAVSLTKWIVIGIGAWLIWEHVKKRK